MGTPAAALDAQVADALDGQREQIAAACNVRWNGDRVLRSDDDAPDLAQVVRGLIDALQRPQPADAGADPALTDAIRASSDGKQPLGIVARQLLHVHDVVAEELVAGLSGPILAEALQRLGACTAQLISGAGIARVVRAELEASRNRTTGLLGKEIFYNDISRACEAFHATGAASVVVSIDLDGLKEINDTEGHDVGDNALRDLASKLQEAVSDSGTAYHLSGDEFALILHADGAVVDEVLARAIENNAPSFSFGSVAITDDLCSRQPENIYHEADILMTEQKRAKKAAR